MTRLAKELLDGSDGGVHRTLDSARGRKRQGLMPLLLLPPPPPPLALAPKPLLLAPLGILTLLLPLAAEETVAAPTSATVAWHLAAMSAARLAACHLSYSAQSRRIWSKMGSLETKMSCTHTLATGLSSNSEPASWARINGAEKRTSGGNADHSNVLSGWLPWQLLSAPSSLLACKWPCQKESMTKNSLLLLE